MNGKFNKNAKVEQLTNIFLSHGEEKGLIVKDPLLLRHTLSYYRYVKLNYMYACKLFIYQLSN